MALLGFQLVLTILASFLIRRLSPYFSVAQWIIGRGLTRYICPPDEVLWDICKNDNKGSLNIPKNKSKLTQKDRKKLNSRTIPKEFKLSKNAPYDVYPIETNVTEVMTLYYCPDFIWIVDFFIYSLAIFSISELYFWLKPIAYGNELNLSVVWLLLSMYFTFKVLSSLTLVYFKIGDGGEKSLCIIFASVYFLLCMIILTFNETILEFGLSDVYDSLYVNTTQIIDPSSPATLISVKIAISIFSSVIGAVLLFPSLRLARMHTKIIGDWPSITWFIAQLSLLLPFVAVLSWVKPLARDTMVAAANRSGVFPEDAAFNTTRLVVLIIYSILRFISIKSHLQAHLNTALDKAANCQKEVRHITNVEFRKKINHVYHYLCIAAIQYIAPVIIILNAALLLKALGGYSWIADETFKIAEVKNSTSIFYQLLRENFLPLDFLQRGHMTIKPLRMMFSKEVLRGLTSFFTWWTCGTYFMSTVFGIIYINLKSRGK